MKEREKTTHSWNLVRYVVAFFVALLIITVFLMTSSLIPPESIQANMEESAQYIENKEQVEYLITGVLGTQLHYSADATWLSISYGFNSEHPFESTMWANYYSGSGGLCKSFA
ncbi:MAG: hypothetical protein J6A79_12370, partial [Clostridia bacterium]|nr:hypothetical protein [Clostridia bacterium]